MDDREKVQQGVFIKRPETQEERDRLAKILSEVPMAYLPPFDTGFYDCLCENCAKEVAGGDIEKFNADRGFDWCGKNLTGDDDEDGPMPFYLIFASNLTINQLDAMKDIADLNGISNMKIEEWDEEEYSGEACILSCEKCEEACVSVDVTEVLGNLGEDDGW